MLGKSASVWSKLSGLPRSFHSFDNLTLLMCTAGSQHSSEQQASRHLPYSSLPTGRRTPLWFMPKFWQAAFARHATGARELSPGKLTARIVT